MSSPPIERSAGSRIPVALQGVFLASNRGEEVIDAPAENVASSVFGRKETSPSSWAAPIRQLRKHLSLGTYKKKLFGVKKTKSFDSPHKQPIKRKATLGRSNTMSTPPLTPQTPIAPTSSPAQKALAARQTPSPSKKTHAQAYSSSSKRSSPRKQPRVSMSPEAYLNALLRNRNYLLDNVQTLQTGYYNTPTPLQKASHHVYIINLAKSCDLRTLNLLISRLSANPCNDFGESLLHSLCRMGHANALQTMIDCGTVLTVADDFGRTPMHDACWAVRPAFAVVELLMKHTQASHYLFHMADARGATPLSYIRKEHWGAWIEFLQAKKDIFWPIQGDKSRPAVVTEMGQNSCPIPDPPHAFPIPLAKLVAAGRMSPSEATLLMSDTGDDDEGSDSSDSNAEDDDVSMKSEGDSDDDDEDSDDDDDDDDSYSSFDSDDSLDSDDDSFLDEATMRDIQNTLAMRSKAPAPPAKSASNSTRSTSCSEGSDSSLDEAAMEEILSNFAAPAHTVPVSS